MKTLWLICSVTPWVAQVAGCAARKPPEPPPAPAAVAAADQAHHDIAEGRLALKEVGFSGAYNEAFARLLRERLGVTLITESAGCVMTADRLDANRAYNEVMLREIDGRFGPGAFQRVQADAHTTLAGSDRPQG